MTIVAIPLIAFGAFVTAYVAYLTILFCANAAIREDGEFVPARIRAINVLIPAHNEELYLPRLLSSLVEQRYPKDRFRVTVIADNCEDRTAAAARQFEVDVLERTDPHKRSKGYAIGWALEQIGLNRFDALVIVDGDSTVSADFLKQLNLQLERGDNVIQCYNGLANPEQSWFTRLMDVSRTIANEIIHPGKRKLGLSSHLMGNGMCFSAAALHTNAWRAFSIGEDWEHYARLVLSGEYIGYSRLARVYHQESVNLQQASSQRLRWSSSRFQVLKQFGPALLIEGIRTRSARCLDASLPLLFPNPSLGINLTVAGFAGAVVYGLITGSAGLAVWFAVLTLAQFAMFMIGVLYTEHRLANAGSIFLAPLFLVWKMGIDLLSLFGRGTKQWKSTERRLL
jgi:1,2-diacylglycerol 3-beta-glucosyltransferase